jgi:type I restriction enzyme S subunit
MGEMRDIPDCKQAKPNIRFDGFTAAWEQRKLGEISDEFRSGEFIRASDITSSGDFPVYGGNGLRGYTSTYNHDGEYALIGRQGALCGNMRFASGKAYFTEHAVAVKANEKNETSFLYHLFGTMNLGQYSGQSAQPGLAVGNLIELKVLVPIMAEQAKISALFDYLDHLITLHQREYDKTVNIKKAMLEKMFPKDGADRPKIRFAGFTDLPAGRQGAWEQRKAVAIFRTTADKNHPELPVLSATQEHGMVRREETGINIFHDKKNEATYKRVLPGQFVIHLRSFQGGFAHSNVEGITSPAYTVLDFIEGEKHYDYFWKYIFNSESFVKRLETVTYGIRDGRSISYDDFSEMGFQYPSFEEQKQIGEAFVTFDHLITLHQRELEKLQNIKKALLEKMFV